MDFTHLHAIEQRRQESESRELASYTDPDSCHTRLDYVPVRKVGEGSGLWRVAYPNLANMEQTMIQQPPILKAVPSESYFGDYASVSQSMLKDFANRRRLYEAYYVTRTAERPKPTDPMRKGTALHTALLEPDRFEEIVCGWPDGLLSDDGGIRTKEAKAYRDQCRADGRVLLKDSERDDVQAMVESIRRVLGKWLARDAAKEKSIFWNDELSGLPLKSRIDWLIMSKKPVLFDIKTTADASPGEFRRACERLGYGIQHAQYIDAVEQAIGTTPLFYFVAVENKFPFACAIHELDEQSADDARVYRRYLLGSLKKCLDSGDFSETWERKINPLSLRPFCFEGVNDE
jgi:hypothetical protein